MVNLVPIMGYSSTDHFGKTVEMAVNQEAEKTPRCYIAQQMDADAGFRTKELRRATMPSHHLNVDTPEFLVILVRKTRFE